MCYHTFNILTYFLCKIKWERKNILKNQKLILRYISIILLVLAVVFIWGNSLKEGSESLEDSGAVKGVIEQILSALGIDVEVGEILIRKTAHFAEYFALGLLACFAAWQNGLPQKPYLSGAFCVLIAVVDEVIQSFVPGRNGNALDVLIDSAGAICAIAAVILILFVKKRKKVKKTLDKEQNNVIQ